MGLWAALDMLLSHRGLGRIPTYFRSQTSPTTLLTPSLGHGGLETTRVSETTQKSYISLTTCFLNQKTISAPAAWTTVFRVCDTEMGLQGDTPGQISASLFTRNGPAT